MFGIIIGAEDSKQNKFEDFIAIIFAPILLPIFIGMLIVENNKK